MRACVYGWIATNGVSQRLYVVLPQALSVLSFAVINMYDSAAIQNMVNFGAKDVRVYVMGVDPGVAYGGGGVSNGVLVYDGSIPINPELDGGENRSHHTVARVNRGRFVVFDFATGWEQHSAPHTGAACCQRHPLHRRAPHRTLWLLMLAFRGAPPDPNHRAVQ